MTFEIEESLDVAPPAKPCLQIKGNLTEIITTLFDIDWIDEKTQQDLLLFVGKASILQILKNVPPTGKAAFTAQLIQSITSGVI